jgi:hypothetical protein
MLVLGEIPSIFEIPAMDGEISGQPKHTSQNAPAGRKASRLTAIAKRGKNLLCGNMACHDYHPTPNDNRRDSRTFDSAARRFSVDSFGYFTYSFYCYFSSFSYGSWESGSGRSSRQAM